MKQSTLLRHAPLASCLFLLFGIGVPMCQAATFFFEPFEAKMGIGEEKEIVLLLDTGGSLINAVEGTLRVPQFVELLQAHDGGSIVDFWIEHPTVTGDSVRFSGIIPGGFDGVRFPGNRQKSAAPVLTFRIRGRTAGTATITIDTMRTLQNDAFGTVLETAFIPLPIEIAPQTIKTLPPVVRDTVLPEPFIPKITRSHDAYKNTHVLLFATTDKGSGMSHYEVSEKQRTFLNAISETADVWVRAKSPYILADQELRSAVKVKAVDRAGNERIAIAETDEPVDREQSPPPPATQRALPYALATLLAVGVASYVYRKIWIKHV